MLHIFVASLYFTYIWLTQSTQSINSVLVLKNVRQCRSDGQKAVYATLHIINHLHIFGIGGGGGLYKDEEEERG